MLKIKWDRLKILLPCYKKSSNQLIIVIMIIMMIMIIIVVFDGLYISHTKRKNLLSNLLEDTLLPFTRFLLQSLIYHAARDVTTRFILDQRQRHTTYIQYIYFLYNYIALFVFLLKKN